jgi:hypothetical protein
MRTSRSCSALVLLVLLHIPLRALANDGTPPNIFALLQQGSDVSVTVRIIDGGEPGLEQAYSLTRVQGDGEVTVFAGRTFLPDEAASATPQCRGGSDDTEYCAEDPEGECLDCDGDGTPECATYFDGWCETAYDFEVLDACVPAGDTTYTLLEEDAELPYDASESLAVTDHAECTPPLGPGAVEEGGCSVGRGGAHGPTPFLLLVSALSLLVRRRRPA